MFHHKGTVLLDINKKRVSLHLEHSHFANINKLFTPHFLNVNYLIIIYLTINKAYQRAHILSIQNLQICLNILNTVIINNNP